MGNAKDVVELRQGQWMAMRDRSVKERRMVETKVDGRERQRRMDERDRSG